MRREAWPVAVVLVVFGAAITASVIANSPPGDRRGIRRFQTPPIGVATIGQRFTMNAPGLAAIDVRPVAVNEPRGSVRATLRADGSDAVIWAAEVPAADLVTRDAYRLAFPPIADSAGRTYLLELSAPAATGVALWATRGERQSNAALTLNGVERWADLAFQAVISGDTRLPWPDPRRPIVIVPIALLAASWYFVILMVRRLHS